MSAIRDRIAIARASGYSEHVLNEDRGGVSSERNQANAESTREAWQTTSVDHLPTDSEAKSIAG